MQRYEKVPFDKAVGTIVVERGIDLLSLFIVTILALSLQFSLIAGFFNEKVLLPMEGKFAFSTGTIVVILAILVAVFHHPMGHPPLAAH